LHCHRTPPFPFEAKPLKGFSSKQIVHVRRTFADFSDGGGDLLSEDDGGFESPDNAEEFRPEVPFVVGSPALTGGGEGLAWQGSGANFSFVIPSGIPEGKGPNSNARAEMPLSVSGQFSWLNKFN
jgi:hypothetical protein